MGKQITKSKEKVIVRTTRFDSDTEDIIMEVQGKILAFDKKRVSIDNVVNDLIKEGYKHFVKSA